MAPSTRAPDLDDHNGITISFPPETAVLDRATGVPMALISQYGAGNESERRSRCLMDELQDRLRNSREIEPPTRVAPRDAMPIRSSRALALGAVAFGAFALAASAIGALAIGRLAVGSFAIKRGRVRKLTVDDLDVRRLHVGELIDDSAAPLRDSIRLLD